VTLERWLLMLPLGTAIEWYPFDVEVGDVVDVDGCCWCRWWRDGDGGGGMPLALPFTNTECTPLPPFCVFAGR